MPPPAPTRGEQGVSIGLPLMFMAVVMLFAARTLRRVAVALRVAALLVFLVGAVISATRGMKL